MQQEPKLVSGAKKSPPSINKLRYLTSWLIVIAVCICTAYVLWLFGFQGANPELWTLLITHFPAMAGLPFAALCALFVVTILRVTQGPIEFEGLGFKFRGASGPIVLWVLCYLVIVASIKLVW
jgi:hypothetical protein